MKHLFAVLSLVLINIVLLCSISVYGRTSRQVILNDSLVGALNILDHNTILDMLDYYDSGRKVDATNLLEGTSSIDTVSPQFLSINLTDASEVQVWVSDTIPSKGTVVISHTYLTPVADGKLEFFSDELLPIKDSKIIDMPTIADFIVIPPTSKKSKADILDMIDMPFISYDINSTTGTITATQNLEEFLGKVDYKPLKQYLIHEISYRWNGKRYVKQ